MQDVEHPRTDEVREGRSRKHDASSVCCFAVYFVVVGMLLRRIVAVCQQLYLTDAVDHHKDKMASPFHPDDIAK